MLRRRSKWIQALACAAFLLNSLGAAAAPIAMEPPPTDSPPCHTAIGTAHAPAPQLDGGITTPLDGNHDCCASPCHCPVGHLPALALPEATTHLAPVHLVGAAPPHIALSAPPLPDPMRPPIA